MSSAKPVRRPNALPARLMRPEERRAELCRLLAIGLVRLKQREQCENSDDAGESCLHYPLDQCRHATPTHRRNA